MHFNAICENKILEKFSEIYSNGGMIHIVNSDQTAPRGL